MRNMLILLLGGSLASPAFACSLPIDPTPPELPKQLTSPPLPVETSTAKPPVWLSGNAMSDADYHRDVAAKLRKSIEELRAMITRNEASAAEQDQLAAKADSAFSAKIIREEALWANSDTIILASMTLNVQRKTGTFANFKPLLTLKSQRKIASFSLENNAILYVPCGPPPHIKYNTFQSAQLYFFKKGAVTDATLLDMLDSSALASPMIREQLRIATEKDGIWPEKVKARKR